MEHFDLVIAGGGILGTSFSYWMSQLYDARIAVVEMAQDVAVHTSGRNTGVIHRPFYLDPEKRKVFARSAQVSCGMWKSYAALRALPWKEVGTLEVAVTAQQSAILEKYLGWAQKNGMRADEVELLDGKQVQGMEPRVHCMSALHSKTDVSVDYGAFTRALKADSAKCGTEFMFGFKVRSVELSSNGLKLTGHKGEQIETEFLLNCAGGNAVDIAHNMGVGLDYTDLHFRGEYWEVTPAKAGMIKTNIYTVPRHPHLPFLDPHWIVRADGRVEIGPNAVLVAGCEAYDGFATSPAELFLKIFERPVSNKLRLFANPEFLKLASEEWMSSLSKKAMVGRVQKFIPDLSVKDFVKRGTAGIRSSVVDATGTFVREAIELRGPRSFHILNYNSPGATGAPAYTAQLTRKLSAGGSLNHLKRRKHPLESFWNFEETVSGF